MNPAPALFATATILIFIGTLGACAIELIKRRPIMVWLVVIIAVVAFLAWFFWSARI